MCKGIGLRFPPAPICLPINNGTEKNTEPVKVAATESHKGNGGEPGAKEEAIPHFSPHNAAPRDLGPEWPHCEGGGTNHACFKDSTTEKGTTAFLVAITSGCDTSYLTSDLTACLLFPVNVSSRWGSRAAPPNFQLPSLSG